MEFPKKTREMGAYAGPYYTLEPLFQNPTIDAPLRVTKLTEALSSKTGRKTEVFRAIVSTVPFDNGPAKKLDVVCKVGWALEAAENVKREAEIYQSKLSELQGKVVPWVHGCYVAFSDTGDIAVLVMAYCGREIPRSLPYMPRGFRCGPAEIFPIVPLTYIVEGYRQLRA